MPMFDRYSGYYLCFRQSYRPTNVSVSRRLIPYRRVKSGRVCATPSRAAFVQLPSQKALIYEVDANNLWHNQRKLYTEFHCSSTS